MSAPDVHGRVARQYPSCIQVLGARHALCAARKLTFIFSTARNAHAKPLTHDVNEKPGAMNSKQRTSKMQGISNLRGRTGSTFLTEFSSRSKTSFSSMKVYGLNMLYSYPKYRGNTVSSFYMMRQCTGAWAAEPVPMVLGCTRRTIRGSRGNTPRAKYPVSPAVTPQTFAFRGPCFSSRISPS